MAILLAGAASGGESPDHRSEAIVLGTVVGFGAGHWYAEKALSPAVLKYTAIDSGMAGLLAGLLLLTGRSDSWSTIGQIGLVLWPFGLVFERVFQGRSAGRVAGEHEAIALIRSPENFSAASAPGASGAIGMPLWRLEY